MTHLRLHSAARVLLLSLCLLLLQIVFSSTVLAQEETSASVRQNITDTYRQKQEALKLELKEKRAQLASTSAAIRDSRKENRDERKELVASTSAARRASIEDRIEAKREEMRDRKEDLRSRLAEKGMAQYERIIKRLLAALERLGDISERIDSRIAKLKAENINMSAAEALNVTAKAAIVTAGEDVRAIAAPIFPSTSDASTTPAMINDAMKTTREAVKKAQTSIAAAQRALGAVVIEIKKAGGTRADAETDTQ